MTIDTAKLRTLIPELEAWTGGERRDLDAKTAEACGWIYHAAIGGRDGMPLTNPHWEPPEIVNVGALRPCWGAIGNNGKFVDLPHYLGTDPSIATEDMQRLVRECGYRYNREEWRDGLQYDVHCPSGLESANSLPLAWARAVIAKEDEK